MREALSLVLAFLLVTPAVPCASPRSADSWKEKVILTGAGSSIDVRLLDKTRLRGRLGAVTDNGFTMDLLKDKKIQPRTIRFDEVKSLKVTVSQQPMSVAAKVGWGILIFTAVAALIGGIACAASNCGTS